MSLALSVAAFGGLGAVLRYVMDNLITRVAGSNFPLGTWTINILGSIAIGVLTGWLVVAHPNHHAYALWGTGLLGGFTTASTFGVEVASLATGGRMAAACLSALSCMALALGGGALGFWVAGG